MAAGLTPTSPEAQTLVERWMRLLHQHPIASGVMRTSLMVVLLINGERLMGAQVVQGGLDKRRPTLCFRLLSLPSLQLDLQYTL